MSLELEFKAGWKLNPTKNGAFRPSTHPTKKEIALPQARSLFLIQTTLKSKIPILIALERSPNPAKELIPWLIAELI
jgi:hypothetical protein